jgi:hypothetical protein
LDDARAIAGRYIKCRILGLAYLGRSIKQPKFNISFMGAHLRTLYRDIRVLTDEIALGFTSRAVIFISTRIFGSDTGVLEV